MPRLLLVLALSVLLSIPAVLSAQTITVTPERESALYLPGETVRWQVSVTNAASLTNPIYSIKSGGMNALSSGSLVLTNGQVTLESRLDQPGWLLLEVSGTNPSGSKVQAYGGALISPELITPAAAKPDDFDAFWRAKLEQLAAVPINPVVTAGSSDRAGVDYATVMLDCINGTHVQGQLARPTSGTKFPALLIVQWAGVYSLQKSWATYRASEGWLVLNTQAHDINPIDTDAYYQALSNGALKDYTRIGNEDRDTSTFLRMYLACHRAVEYLSTRPDWDGRTIVVMGASQGGLQTLVAAALHPKVTAALAEVPAGSDQAGLDAGRIPGWPMWAWQAWDRDQAKVLKASRYYDVTNFAPMIRCPVLVGTGLLDTVVPPPGVYATYNLLQGARQIVAMPLADHSNNHSAYSNLATSWLTEARTARQPVISTAPKAASAILGGTKTFSVAASNGLAFGYQWLKNGVAIPGATKDTLTLANIGAKDEAQYSVVVTSPGGSITSPPAALTVSNLPSTTLDKPVSPNAIPELHSLMDYLNSISGSFILSGQQEDINWFGTPADPANGPEMSFIKNSTGKLPALLGTDFMFLNDIRDVDAQGRPYQKIPERVKVWVEKGGIASICWHWNAGTPRRSFYTADSDFNLQRALDEPNSADGQQFVKDMDGVALELKKLADAKIPVIWRPFHEVSGNQWGAWFWWGAKGADVFKRAYRFMFDRFTRVHGLNNLLWVYNPTDLDGALDAWYPGDDVIDMISLDIYPTVGTHPSYASNSEQFRNYRNGRKLVALSENGPIPDPDQLFSDGAIWSYFCTWSGDFITNSDASNGNHNPIDFIQRVYNHPKVLTLDELPDVYHRQPQIKVQPTDAGVNTGARVSFSVLAMSPMTETYQWKKDGIDIPGATSSSYTVPSAAASDASSYSVVVTNSLGSTTSSVARLTVSSSLHVQPTSTLLGLSTRAYVGSGDDLLIGGFIIGGTGAKRLVIRASTPRINGTAIAGAVADPTLNLTLINGTVIASNDDWEQGSNKTELDQAYQALTGSSLGTGSKDAAILVSLPPGIYTALTRGSNGSTGVGMLEIYDVDTGTTSNLRAISARSNVGLYNEPLFAGFVTQGDPRRYIVQGIGPAMAAYIPGLLANPKLRISNLRTGAEVVSNDDWSSTTANRDSVIAAHSLGGSPLAADSKDAALVITQEAINPFSAILESSTDGATGIGLIEVYDVQP